MIVVACFGVRRGAEVVAFLMRDVTLLDDGQVRLKVVCQKNDQCGIGQVCLIPDISSLDACSPCGILRLWLQTRQKAQGHEPVFTTTCGSNQGSKVSTDWFRKLVATAFGHGKSSHSLRKGGAVFYARGGAAEDATRQQGGWRTSEVMRTIYTTLSTSEVEREISVTAAKATVRLQLSKLVAVFRCSPSTMFKSVP